VTVTRYVWPALFLAAVTLALFGLRAWYQKSPAAPAAPRHHAVHHRATKGYYRVRAGDTLAAVAGRTGVSTARLQKLNPSLNPTALFLGQRIRLR
jgi:LysM domain